mgnify:CR=1 FL=1
MLIVKECLLYIYNEYKNGKYTLEDAENIAKHRKASLPDKPDSPPIAKIAVNDNVNVNDIKDKYLSSEYYVFAQRYIDVLIENDKAPPKKTKATKTTAKRAEK